jgi:superfamily II helicase
MKVNFFTKMFRMLFSGKYRKKYYENNKQMIDRLIENQKKFLEQKKESQYFVGMTPNSILEELIKNIPQMLKPTGEIFYFDTKDKYTEYHEKHKYCPNCGDNNYEQTLAGYVMGNNGNIKDENRCICHSCGWKGIVDELVQEKKNSD